MFASEEELAGEYIVYCKTGCLYCTKAFELLTKNNLRFTSILCDNILAPPNGKKMFLSFMKKKANQSVHTFPMIFKGDTFIGGYTELHNYLYNYLF